MSALLIFASLFFSFWLRPEPKKIDVKKQASTTNHLNMTTLFVYSFTYVQLCMNFDEWFDILIQNKGILKLLFEYKYCRVIETVVFVIDYYAQTTDGLSVGGDPSGCLCHTCVLRRIHHAAFHLLNCSVFRINLVIYFKLLYSVICNIIFGMSYLAVCRAM